MFGSLILLLVSLVISLWLYFIPSLIARKRGHPDNKAIFILNLFLGWLFVPWVISLVWAYKKIIIPDVRRSDNEANFYSKENLGKVNAAEFKKCPFCAEDIKSEAVKCKHCGSRIESSGFGVRKSDTTELVGKVERVLERPSEEREFIFLIEKKLEQMRNEKNYNVRREIYVELRKLIEWFKGDFPQRCNDAEGYENKLAALYLGN